jgi:hypothetical protein
MCEQQLGTPTEIYDYITKRIESATTEAELVKMAKQMRLEAKRDGQASMETWNTHMQQTFQEAPLNYETLREEIEDFASRFKEMWSDATRTATYKNVLSTIKSGLSKSRIPQGQSADEIWEAFESRTEPLLDELREWEKKMLKEKQQRDKNKSPMLTRAGQKLKKMASMNMGSPCNNADGRIDTTGESMLGGSILTGSGAGRPKTKSGTKRGKQVLRSDVHVFRGNGGNSVLIDGYAGADGEV